MSRKYQTIVINLFGASCVGKSTTAAALFAELKRQGYHTELIREYVKGWAHLGLTPSGYDQVYLFGKQARFESQLYGKMEVLVTDSPLLISGFYENWHLNREISTPSILNFIKYAEEQGVIYVNFWLEKYGHFDTRGRFESEESSKAVHRAMRPWLENLGIRLTTVDVDDRDREAFIISELERILKENIKKDEDAVE